MCAPNEGLIKSYVEGLLDEFMCNPEVKLCLTLKLCKQFRTYTEKLSNNVKAKTACRLAAENLVHTIPTLRKTNAGKFLKHVREINCLDINDKADFGDPLHSVHSEPFYYETAYLHCFQLTRLTIDNTNRCFSLEHVTPNSDYFVSNDPIPLDAQERAHILEGSACLCVCRTVSDDDVEVILDIKCAFEKPIPHIREQLQNIDKGCPHVHYLKPRGMEDGLACTELTKLGHPLPCSSGMCSSKLQVLRAASVHYPALRKFLYSVYMARRCHSTVAQIDLHYPFMIIKALCDLIQLKEYENLIGDSVEMENTDLPSSDNIEFSAEGLLNVERDL